MNRKLFSGSLLFFAITGLFAATDCSGGAGFCDTFCTHYTGCVDDGKAGGDRPLFCGLGDADRHESCVAMCRSSAERLGESQGAFDTCASCVVRYLDKDTCSDSDMEDLAKTSCAQSCASKTTGSAAKAFQKSFHADFDEQDAKSCNRTGTVTFSATDDRIGHKVGEEGSGGAWTCKSDCSYDHIMYGPYVSLPPGRYTAGFRDVRIGGATGDGVATLDVYCGQTIVEHAITSTEAQGSELSVSFTLSKTERSCEVRLQLNDPAATATIRSTFFTRK